MDSVAIGRACCFEDLLVVEVGGHTPARDWLAEPVTAARRKGRVILRMDQDRYKAFLAGCPRDPDGNLAAVGN